MTQVGWKKLERECGRSSQCKTWFAHIERRSLLGHINFRLRSGGSDWSIAFTWLARDSIFANNSDCKIGPMVLDANKRGGRTSPRWQWLRQEGHESEKHKVGVKRIHAEKWIGLSKEALKMEIYLVFQVDDRCLPWKEFQSESCWRASFWLWKYGNLSFT